MKTIINTKQKILRKTLLLFCFVHITQIAISQNYLQLSLGVDRTTLKDEISSLFNFKGVIPGIGLSYVSENDQRIHDVRIGLEMGNPTQRNNFSSLLMGLNLGYKYLRAVKHSTNSISYLGGGFQSIDYFQISDLGKTTYLFENSLNLNYQITIPYKKNRFSFSCETPIISLISRSPYSVFSPELREKLNEPLQVPFYNSNLHLPFDYFRVSTFIGISRSLGDRWLVGFDYLFQFLNYNKPANLTYAKMDHSFKLSIAFKFNNPNN